MKINSKNLNQNLGDTMVVNPTACDISKAVTYRNNIELNGRNRTFKKSGG